MTVPSNLLHERNLIVTGGTGFVGSAFVRHAVRAGARVTIIGRVTADHWRLADLTGRYHTLRCSLPELADVSLAGISLAASSPATMVHFAAAGVNQTTDDITDMAETNVAGTVSALQFAQRNGLSRFVLVGSSGEYGSGVGLSEDAPLRPTSEYGATRASATLVARAFGARRGLDVVVVRPFAVFGPFEARYRLIPHVILCALRGQPIRISSGDQTRDYIHVDDVSDGIARACAMDAARGGIYNLCSGHETRVRDVARLVTSLAGSHSSVEAGAMPTIPGEMWRTSGDPSHARSVLGWTPQHDLAQRLRETIAWFRDTGLTLPAYTEATA